MQQKYQNLPIPIQFENFPIRAPFPPPSLSDFALGVLKLYPEINIQLPAPPSQLANLCADPLVRYHAA